MTYTEDRETFERDIFRPPHVARMLEHAGRYVGSMTKADKDAFLELALDHMWERRAFIKQTSDIQRMWELALQDAARSRLRWLIWPNGSLTESKWVLGTRLGVETL